MILAKSICFGKVYFGRVQFVFGWVQIIKISPWKSNLNLAKMIWIFQNELDPTKPICTNPKQFERSKIILDL